MPVPDQVRDDGSGIQQLIDLKAFWIPDQVRNDKREIYSVLTFAAPSLIGRFSLKAPGFPFDFAKLLSLSNHCLRGKGEAGCRIRHPGPDPGPVTGKE